MGDFSRKYFAVQFHPEVQPYPARGGAARALSRSISAAASPDWTPASIIDEAWRASASRWAGNRCWRRSRGGVDSSVAAALVHKAIGDQLVAVFVDTGLLRQDEPEQVVATFRNKLGAELIAVDAAEEYFAALAGVDRPGAETQDRRREVHPHLRAAGQSSSASRNSWCRAPSTRTWSNRPRRTATRPTGSRRITTWAGCRKIWHLQLVEPLRYLFKDEVRAVGEALGLPEEMVWRQPFPGPGLTVRCLGEVTRERVERLRRADAIFTGELAAAGLLGKRRRRHRRLLRCCCRCARWG